MAEISLIIPVYKVAQYLPACLDSVLAQTFQDWEALCVDDGSPDNCGAILADYAKRDKRIHVITQNNRGVSNARNNALSSTTSDYICFLDSDDELAPNFLSKIYALAKKHKADIVACDIMHSENCDHWRSLPEAVRCYTHPFDAYMLGNLNISTSVWGKLYRSNLLRPLKFNSELQYGEDILYLHQALYYANTLVYTNLPLYFYRIHPESAMSTKLSERFAFNNIKTATLLLEWFKDKQMSSKTRQKLNEKIAKRIFKFAIMEPKRKDKDHLEQWYAKTRPVLQELKQQQVYQPQYLSLKNQFKSWLFLRHR